jgi:hypothetical protein
MTRAQILRMAEEAGFFVGESWRDAPIVRFAALVAAAEREACASEVWPTETKVWSEEELQAMTAAFNRAQEKRGWYETLMAVGASVLKMKAAAIRARGQE